MGNLLQQLRELEVYLQQPEVRCNRDRLDGLLHESFGEYGRSGRIYDKADILEQLPQETGMGEIWPQDFRVVELADGLAMLTYRSSAVDEEGNLYRHTNRSSLWQRTENGWQMRFHQGTPTEAFDRSSNNR